MITVDQTRIGKGGNCFQACVASMLYLNLDDVPDFCNEYPETWFLEFTDWLRQFGMTAIMLKYDWEHDMAHVLKDTYVMVGGPSAVRDISHEVIYYNGELFHDPAPEKKGLKYPADMIVLVSLEPAKLVRSNR